MTVLLEFALTMVCLVSLAGMFLWFHDIRATPGHRWRALPPSYARIGVASIILTAALLLTEGTLLIAEPWGRETAVYVVVPGGSSLLLLALSAGALQAILRARRLRSADED